MTSATKTLSLTMAAGKYAYISALRDGSVRPEGIELQQVDVSPIPQAFRRMCRGLEFDICEMAICTYLAAKEVGLPFTAIPVYVLAHSQHEGMYIKAGGGIKSPKDLEGKTIGSRAWSLTPAVWMRGILQHEYGVDISSFRHILADEEHVKEFNDRIPAGVERRVGADLGQLLKDGEIACVTGGRFDSPEITTLIPEPEKAAAEYTERTGIDPLDHFLVIKDSLLAEHPWIAPALYEACKASKTQWQHAGPADSHGHGAHHDPMPIGMSPEVVRSLEPLLQFSYDQRVTSRKYSAEELFTENTRTLQ
jgi:4,5-dihydroxyphthalate decarboxylase